MIARLISCPYISCLISLSLYISWYTWYIYIYPYYIYYIYYIVISYILHTHIYISLHHIYHIYHIYIIYIYPICEGFICCSLELCYWLEVLTFFTVNTLYQEHCIPWMTITRIKFRCFEDVTLCFLWVELSILKGIKLSGYAKKNPIFDPLRPG